MNCKCGFKFSGPGEFRNSEAFILDGNGGVICPKCGQAYVCSGGQWYIVDLKEMENDKIQQ